MTTIRTAVQLILLGYYILFSAGASFALSSKESLKGLRGVEVLVEEIGADLEDYNVTTYQVLVEVVSRLNKAGIEVLSREEDEKIQPLRKPYLAVKISSYKTKQGFALAIQLGLNQQVIIRGTPELKKTPFFAPTWYTTFVGAVSLSRVSEIHEVLNNLIDKFTSAYLEANPKQ
jgi:hypothetical protein